MASVDVIVPCYNYGRYLPDCVNSALSQHGVDVRVIVIDDQSSDNTPEVGGELASVDARVEFHRHAVNRGHIATYNEGLEMARGDYVVLLSADDLLTPGALHRATRLMDAHPSVGFVYGHPITLHGSVPAPARTRVISWSVWPGADWIARMCRSGQNFIICPEVVMRTRVQHEIGGYRPSLPHSGDMEMWMRAAAISDVGRINGVDQAYYRVHSASMQRTVHAGFVFDLKGRLDAFESAFAGPAGRLPGAEAMLETAKRALAVLAIERGRKAYEYGLAALEPIDDYCQFAQSVYPRVLQEKTWRSLNRARQACPSQFRRLTYQVIARYRQVQEHIAWRRWWQTGLF